MRTPVLIVPGLAIVACIACDGGQTGDEGARCDPVATTDLAIDEDSPLGFSGADVLAFAAGSHTATLTWEAGGTSEVTVDVTHDGTVKFVEYEWVDDGSGQEIAMDCADQVELGIGFTFVTADGAFDEDFTGRLDATTAEAAGLFDELDLEDLTGTYEITDETDTSDYDDIRAFLTLSFEPAAWSGKVEGQGSGSTGDGPDDTAYAESFDIATW